MAAVLVLATCFSVEGSVWWKWWNSTDQCIDKKESEIVHREWGPKDECLHAETLQIGDPIHELGEELINALESSWDVDHGRKIDVMITCTEIHPYGTGEMVMLTYYNTSDASCGGLPIIKLHINESECGTVGNVHVPVTTLNVSVATHFTNSRFMCTRCNWVFYNESAPPYVVQAAGILIFLVGCIVLNFLLQDKLDRLMKTLPNKIPCCGKNKLDHEEIRGFHSGYAARMLAKAQPKKLINIEREPLSGGVRKKRPSTAHRRRTSESISPNDTPTQESPEGQAARIFVDNAFKKPRRSNYEILNARMSLDIINLLECPPGNGSAGRGLSIGTKSSQFDSNPLFPSQLSPAEETARPFETPDTTETPLQLHLPRQESLQSSSSLFRGSDSVLNTPYRETSDVILDWQKNDKESAPLTITVPEPSMIPVTPVDSTASLTEKEPLSIAAAPASSDLISHYASHSAARCDEEEEEEEEAGSDATSTGEEPIVAIQIAGGSESVVGEYYEHSTSGSKTSPKNLENEKTEPLLDIQQPNGEMRNRHRTMTLTRRMKMCAVCGMDSETGRLKNGNWKCTTCASQRKKVNPILTAPPLVEHGELKDMANRGNLGFFCGISAVSRRHTDTLQAFVGFRNCAVWMPSELFSYAEREAYDPALSKSEFYVSPSVRATSPQQCSTWLSLAKGLGYIITEVDNSSSMTAIQLQKPVHTWVPCTNLEVISKAWDGGKYARLAEKSELKKVCGDRWQKWWKDFELCVGTVVNVGRDTNNEHYAIISFQGSATLVVPVAALLSCSEAEHDSEYLITPQPISKRMMMAVFVASAPPLLAGKGIFLMSFFALSIVQALSDGHSGRANHHNKWEAYEEVYFKLFNSGYPTLMADCGSVTFFFWYSFSPTFHQFASGVGRPVMIALGISLLVSLPGLVTHALPMVVMYLWIWIPVGIILFLISKYILLRFQPQAPDVGESHNYDLYFHMKYHRIYIIKAGAFYLGCRFVAEFVAVMFVQTSFNYGVFIYDYHPYLQTIMDDVNGRKFACLWEMGLKLASLLW